MRTVLWFLSFGVYMIVCACKYVKLMWLKKKSTQDKIDNYTYYCGKAWANFVIRTLGAEVKVTGKENLPEENCLFVANHQGYLDIPVFLSIVDKPLGFVAKKELQGIPVLSNWMKALHCIFMDRDNVREAVKAIGEGIDYLKAGYSLAIFPEGTRSKNTKVGEFKKGSMKFAVRANVPIVPVTINGTYKAFEERNRINKCSVSVKIGKPIYLDRLTKEEQNNLSNLIRDKIKENLN